MTLYLTDNTPPEEVIQAREAGIVAFKLYPAGATTNSDSGVTDWRKCLATLKTMAEVRVPPFSLDLFGFLAACFACLLRERPFILPRLGRFHSEARVNLPHSASPAICFSLLGKLCLATYS